MMHLAASNNRLQQTSDWMFILMDLGAKLLDEGD